MMEKAIEYVRLRFEEMYYSQDTGIRTDSRDCMRSEGLECNCISGMIMNYAGYILSICLPLPLCRPRFLIDEGIGYIKVEYGGKELITLNISDQNVFSCHLSHMVCQHQDREKGQVYIPFRKYRDLEEIKNKIRDSMVMKEVFRHQGIYACYRLELWIYFLKAMRLIPISISSRAFLSMAVFMFPGKTLGYINEGIMSGTISEKEDLERLADFFIEYLVFIKKLQRTTVNGYFFEFVAAFECLTQVHMASFFEMIIHEKRVDNSEENLYSVLVMAYNRNKDEQIRRRGGFKTLVNRLKEIQVSREKVLALESLLG